MKHNIGQQIGSWEIVNWLPTEGNYELKCSCGNQGKGSATYVDSKISALNSTGFTACRSCTGAYKRESKTDQEKLHRVYKNYLKSAEARNLEFELTVQKCQNLFQKRCFYCNELPENIENYYKIKYQGIDRIDNNKGYIPNNVIPCCSFCNYAKHFHSQEKFLDKVSKIYLNVQRLGESRTQKSGETGETQ